MSIEMRDFMEISQRIRPAPLTQTHVPPPSDELRHFKQIASQSNVIFFFSGYFSQGVVETSAEAIKSRLEASNANSKVKRRLLSSFIEIAQNIVHYSAEAATDITAQSDEFRFGTLCIGANGDHYNIMCANPMLTATHSKLKHKLELLRHMSLEEIKQAYRDTMHAEEGEDDSKGAGLGFLMLARDAREPIEFEFADDPAWGSEFKMFYLKVSI
jgi:hypothetical protein